MSNVFYIERVSESSSFIKKNQNRANQMTTNEKRKLARLVREKEQIWNLTHPRNKDVTAHEEAWQEISAKMEKPKETCKISWKALKDCFRYRVKVAEKMRKQGEIESSKDYIESNWEFAKDLAFLADAGKPRQRYITYIDDQEIENEDEEQDDNSQSTSSFAVKDEIDPINTEKQHNESKKRRLSQTDQSFDNNYAENSAEFLLENDIYQSPAKKSSQSNDLVYQLEKLVQAQTEFMREFKDSGTGKLIYKYQLIAVDALLQQLPKNLAKKTLVEIQNYVLKKVNEHQRNLSDSD